MKKLRLVLLLLIATMLSTSMFAQSVGELDKFERVELEKTNEVKLFPNPTVDFLSVQILNSDLENVTLTVHNIIGNVVEVKVIREDDHNFKINVEDLPTGYYLLALKDNDKHFRETYKFLKR